MTTTGQTPVKWLMTNTVRRVWRIHIVMSISRLACRRRLATNVATADTHSPRLTVQLPWLDNSRHADQLIPFVFAVRGSGTFGETSFREMRFLGGRSNCAEQSAVTRTSRHSRACCLQTDKPAPDFLQLMRNNWHLLLKNVWTLLDVRTLDAHSAVMDAASIFLCY